MRTIDADALKDEIRQDLMKYACMIPPVAAIRAVDCVIDKQPTIEPRAKGHWIEFPGVIGVAYCSECNHQLTENNTNFCPNCGADMREENDD